MDPFLHCPMSLCVSQSLGLSGPPQPPHLSPHPGSLPHRAQGPTIPQDGYRTPGKRDLQPGSLGARFLRPRSSGPQTPASPLSLPPAPGHRGPVALVSEVFEQHLGGHILQVRPLPCLLLLAATWWPCLETAPFFLQHPSHGEHQVWEVECWGSPFCQPLPSTTKALFSSHPRIILGRVQISESLTGARLSSPSSFVSPTLVPGWLRVCLEPRGQVPLHLRDGLHLSGSLTGKGPQQATCTGSAAPSRGSPLMPFLSPGLIIPA